MPAAELEATWARPSLDHALAIHTPRTSKGANVAFLLPKTSFFAALTYFLQHSEQCRPGREASSRRCRGQSFDRATPADVLLVAAKKIAADYGERLFTRCSKFVFGLLRFGSTHDALDNFHPIVRQWFLDRFASDRRSRNARLGRSSRREETL